MIIAIEGIDASGKATQTTLLAQKLNKLGYNTERFDFPRYDSLSGKSILSLLKREWNCGDNNSIVLQSLMTVNRYEFYDLLKSYSFSGQRRNKILVLDRYYLSGIAYGLADGLDEKFLLSIHQALPKPDICLFLDISAEESVKRRPDRRDEYEKREGFMHKVRDIYLNLFNSKENCFVLDGTGTVEEVNARIFQFVSNYLEL